MAEENIPESPRSPKHRFRSSLCFSCCFGYNRHVKPRLVRSSSLVHSKTRSGSDLPHLMEKCTNLISRIGRHNRRHSADFHYDAFSYSLNFEDDATDDKHLDEDCPYIKNFSARLPQSPPPKTPSDSTTTTAAITALS